MDYFCSRPKLVPEVETGDLSDGDILLRLDRYAYGSSYVDHLPSYFFSIQQALPLGRALGQCDLRVGVSPELAYAGEIGYRVHVAHRGNGYAGQATRLLLVLAHRLGKEEVLITCDPDNTASRKTLEGLGGRFAGIITVPPGNACYSAGDRQKCQFYFKTEPFAQWFKALPK